MARIEKCLVLVICCLQWTKMTNGQSECYEAARGNQIQLTNCLNDLRTLLHDTNKYFFGISYSSRCPSGLLQTSDCFTYVPPPPYSIIARMTGTAQQMDTSNLDRWLEVNYTSSPGNYTGCDYFYEDTDMTEFPLDPLVDPPYTPWLTRLQPVIRWDTSEDSNDQLYTLLFQDVGYGVTHSLWMDIQGNNLSTATVIAPYLGPGNPRELPNVYIYFLFKQNRRIGSLSQSWEEVISDFSNPAYLQLHWIEFMADHGLSGPIATNWMTITGDPYSAQWLADIGIEMNCAFYVNRELQKYKSSRPFLPQSFDLSVFMRINYNALRLKLDICCNGINYDAENVFLDPIGSAMIKAPTTRAVGSKLTVSLHKNKRLPDDANDFQGEYYTLIMVDPDLPADRSSFGTNQRPLVHWLVIDAPKGNISEGTELLAYRQPRPPNSELHTYYFLLYKQMTNSTLNIANTNGYTIGCDRCRFAVELFASENQLSLAGASWMRVQNDVYVNYTYAVQDGPLNETIFCENVPGFDDPCPSGNGPQLCWNLKLVFCSMLLLINL